MNDWTGWIAFGGLWVLVGLFALRWYIRNEREYTRGLAVRNIRQVARALTRAKAHDLDRDELVTVLEAVIHLLEHGTHERNMIHFPEKIRAVYKEWLHRDFSQF
jgi:hypothetical protein